MYFVISSTIYFLGGPTLSKIYIYDSLMNVTNSKYIHFGLMTQKYTTQDVLNRGATEGVNGQNF